MEKIKTICCAAGKSGGHIIPNLIWARARYPNHKIVFFSARTPLDYRLLENKVEIHIPLGLHAGKWYTAPYTSALFIFSIIKSVYFLIRHKPSIVLSTGGITAVPVCIAAFLLRIPIELFELNATPGTAIRWLAPLATTIHVCFESAKIDFKARKVMLSPYPIRFDIKSTGGKIFADSERTTIFIQGGSQGSVSLNKKIKQFVEENRALHSKINIIHQIGSYDTYDWSNFYKQNKIPAIVFQFQQNLASYYTAADIVICRAGAGQLFETVYFSKRCITIPLEIRTNTHQLENARAIQTAHPHLFTIVRQHESLPKEIV